MVKTRRLQFKSCANYWPQKDRHGSDRKNFSSSRLRGFLRDLPRALAGFWRRRLCKLSHRRADELFLTLTAAPVSSCLPLPMLAQPATASFMNKQTNRVRLDQLLTNSGMSASRSRARDTIARGCVTVDGQKIHKAGQLVDPACAIEINDPASKYVSRSALKLVAGLEAAGIDPNGKTAVDLGASTGGFTQVLLERGVKSVLAIDVGHGQLVQWIVDDPRVTNLEGMNARHLSREILMPEPDLIVSDVSFISLRQAAEPALLLSASQASCVLLVKPQFEVGRDGIAKGGLVKDEALARDVVEQIKTWLEKLPGWAVTSLIPSPIAGADGNQEFLLCGARHA